MYRKEKPIALKGSTSAICNNLSVQVNLSKNLINYAVAHKSVVNLACAATDGSTVNHKQLVCKEPSGGTSIIIQVSVVKCNDLVNCLYAKNIIASIPFHLPVFSFIFSLCRTFTEKTNLNFALYPCAMNFLCINDNFIRLG